ncbi:hypothetical protein ACFLZI_02645 [Nitrospirota bacterium]
MRLSRLIFPLLLVALLMGCSGVTKIQTDESIFAVKAYDLAEGLREAYVNKDFSGMRRFCTKDVYDAIRGEIKSFDSVELEFDPEWMETGKEGDATMRILWKGTWKVKGKAINKEGRLIMILGGRPLKVSSIQWGSPFKQPDIVRTLPSSDMLK